MINIIPPTPTQKDSNDQIEIRKAFNDLSANVSQQINNVYTSFPTIVPTIFPTWQPYPAGTYVFPSGNQSPASGILTVGAVTTAPTFGTGSVLRAWYRSWGSTIDIMWQLIQSSTTGSAVGNGIYLFPLPLGFTLDTSILTIDTNGYNGACFGSGRWSSTLVTNAITQATPYNSTLFKVYATSSASDGPMSSTSYNNGTPFAASGLYTGIPVI